VSSSAAGRSRRFEDEVVLITGTGGGQGRAGALRFAAEGAVVVGADITTAGHAETVAMVEAEGGVMTGSGTLDLTVADDVRGWVQQAVSEHGGIDVVYDNAGVFTGLASSCRDDPRRRARCSDLTRRRGGCELLLAGHRDRDLLGRTSLGRPEQ
jgi:NAD(P)-dependent dehydrogenase (short-subunit alcohol dehydrogenase family)